MNAQDMRKTLITNTIKIIAEEGLDKTTTKAIASSAGINEVYIYRCFKNKENLLAEVFDYLDNDLFDKAIKHVEVMYMTDLDFTVRSRIFFETMWKLLLEDKNECVAFVRYYYSPYFTKLSDEGHTKRFAPLVERFRPAFKDDADVWMILNHMLHVMLAFAIMVHNDRMPQKDNYSEHVFMVLYASVSQYFKNSDERGS